MITLSQPNYSYGCFVVGVVVVVELGSFLTFLTLWAFLGGGVGFKNCFGVSSYRLSTFVFRVLLYFCSIM